MGSCPPAIQNYWGYLVEPDKTASPRLEDLLLGIAHYIVGLSVHTHDYSDDY